MEYLYNHLKWATFLFFFTVIGTTNLWGQQRFVSVLDTLPTLEQPLFFSGVSSNLVPKGSAEVTAYSSLVSVWQQIHQSTEDSPVLSRLRFSSFTTDILAFYGFSATGRWNAGLNLRYTRSRLDTRARSSIFKVFEAEDEEDEDGFNNSIGAFTGLGLKFRAIPFDNVPELMVTGGYTASLVKEEKEQRTLAADRDIFDVGLSYYIEINPNVYYFFSTGNQIFLASEVRDEVLYSTTLNFFLVNRTTNSKFSFYPGLSYTIRYKPSKFDDHALVKMDEQLLAYAGIQYAPTTNVNFFAMGALPFILEDSHPQTKLVRGSYSLFSLGIRGYF